MDLRLNTPHDFAVAAPYLGIGGLLPESVSIIGLRDGKAVQVSTVSARAPHDSVTRNHFDRLETPGVVIMGQGSGGKVSTLMHTLVDGARMRGLDTLSLRTHQGRYWSDACQECDICPSEGHEVDPTASLDIIEALWRRDTSRAVPRPLMDHANRIFQPADITPQVEEAIATQGAGDRPGTESTDKVAFVTNALIIEARGDGPRDAQSLAHLIVLMRDQRILESINPSWDTAPTHLDLWTRVTAAATGADRAGPAYLAAIAAWIIDDLIMARAAVEEALRVQPGYTAALRMQRALDLGLPVQRVVALSSRTSAMELPPVEVPRADAWGYCNILADGTIEHPLYENSTCVEYDAMMQLLRSLGEAGMDGLATMAQEFQTEGHVSTSHVAGDQCRSVPQLAAKAPGHVSLNPKAPALLIRAGAAQDFCEVLSRETYTNALYARRSTCMEWFGLRDLLKAFQSGGVRYAGAAMRLQEQGHHDSGMCLKDCLLN